MEGHWQLFECTSICASKELKDFGQQALLITRNEQDCWSKCYSDRGSTYSNVNNIEKMKKWPLKVILSSCTWRSNIVNFLGGLVANSDANVCVEKYWPVSLYYQSICIEKCGSVSLFYQQRDEHVYIQALGVLSEANTPLCSNNFVVNTL